MNFHVITSLAGFLLLAQVCIGESVAPPIQQRTVEGLVARITPNLKDKFIIAIVPGEDGDYFNMESTDEGKVKITASDGVAASSAYHLYLREYLHSQVSWTDENLDFARSVEELPKIEEPIKKERFLKWSYYMNQTVASYSTIWWKWEDWEKHIDWIATRGINMPLMFVGQEYVWSKTFLEFGLTLEDLEPFFAGPAYLAWQRMGNFRGWGGPLTTNWMTEHYILGRKVFDRMRSFGMKPVLPAFAGHVPTKFEEIATDSDDITKSDSYLSQVFPHDNCCVRFVEASSELFAKIGSSFIKNLIDAFGPNEHLYNGDLYNEMYPRSSDPQYLADLSKAVLGSMQAVDPDAIWVLQGWAFHFGPEFWGPEQIEAHLGAVDNEHMIILDLWTETNPVWSGTNSFYGKPFLWCELLNFGGNLVMTGRMNTVMNGPYETAENSSMAGIGVTAEGLFTNELMFDMLFDHAWAKGPVPILDWVYSYIHARYGQQNHSAQKAWKVFSETAFDHPPVGLNKARIVKRPSLGLYGINYSHCDFLPGWGHLIDAGDELKDVGTYRFDLVDTTRQAMSNLFEDWFSSLRLAGIRKDVCNVELLRPRMLDLLADMDEVLATHQAYLYGRWLQDAEQHANNQAEWENLKLNAKYIVTLWGPQGQLSDYSARMWSGLLRDYYLPRWEIAFDQLLDDIKDGKPFDEELFIERSKSHDYSFIEEEKVYRTEPYGDPLEVSQRMHKKYISAAQAACPGEQDWLTF